MTEELPPAGRPARRGRLRFWARRAPAPPSAWLEARAEGQAQIIQSMGDANVSVHVPRPEVSWPLRVGSPPAAAADLQHRPQLWPQLHAADAGPGPSLVLTGDGGVGKSQLAAAALRHALAADGVPGVDLGVWITASSRDAVLTGLAAAWAATHPEVEGQPGADARQPAEAFLSWLATTRRRWLLVLDDLADPADLAGLRPEGPHGRLLVTTRRRDARTAALGRLLPVGVFEPEESQQYLTRRLAPAQLPSGALDGAAALAEELGRLPLALAQAAAVIHDQGSTCSAFQQQLADRRQNLAGLFPADPLASGDSYARAVPAVWSLATEQAGRQQPGVPALLRLAAVLDPNGIPAAVLATPAAATHVIRLGRYQGPPPPDPDPAALAAVGASIRAAHHFSLLTHTPADPVRSVRMHALAGRAAWDLTEPEDQQLAVATAGLALAQAWPDRADNPELLQVLHANITAAVDHDLHRDVLWRPQLGIHQILITSGHSLGEAGQVEAARDYFARLAPDTARALGEQHPDTLTVRLLHATWTAQAGDLATAAADLGRLLTEVSQALGPRHQLTLGVRNQLARVRGEAGDPEAAVSELTEVVAEQIAVLGPQHRDVLVGRTNLAYRQGEAGDLPGAVAGLTEVVADLTRLVGADHPDTLSARSNLIRYQARLFGPAFALQALPALLADQQRTLGPDHVATLVTRNNLAYWQGRGGDAAAAAAGFAALLPDRIRVLGPDHPNTLDNEFNLALWTGEAGDPAAAVRGIAATLPRHVRVYGADHPRTLEVRQQLANWQDVAGGVWR